MTRIALLVGLLAALGAVLGQATWLNDYRVRFDVETTAGAESFTVKVTSRWAPIGAARFRHLVKQNFYDDTRFFRVIPGFMAQFGLSGKPHLNAHWRANPIDDEKVGMSNQYGFISFAKMGQPNSRTTQLFINYADNKRLDDIGFAPFGKVEGDGMEVVKRIFNWCAQAVPRSSLRPPALARLRSSPRSRARTWQWRGATPRGYSDRGQRVPRQKLSKPVQDYQGGRHRGARGAVIARRGAQRRIATMSASQWFQAL